MLALRARLRRNKGDRARHRLRDGAQRFAHAFGECLLPARGLRPHAALLFDGKRAVGGRQNIAFAVGAEIVEIFAACVRRPIDSRRRQCGLISLCKRHIPLRVGRLAKNAVRNARERAAIGQTLYVAVCPAFPRNGVGHKIGIAQIGIVQNVCRLSDFGCRRLRSVKQSNPCAHRHTLDRPNRALLRRVERQFVDRDRGQSRMPDIRRADRFALLLDDVAPHGLYAHRFRATQFMGHIGLDGLLSVGIRLLRNGYDRDLPLCRRYAAPTGAAPAHYHNQRHYRRKPFLHTAPSLFITVYTSCQKYIPLPSPSSSRRLFLQIWQNLFFSAVMHGCKHEKTSAIRSRLFLCCIVSVFQNFAV